MSRLTLFSFFAAARMASVPRIAGRMISVSYSLASNTTGYWQEIIMMRAIHLEIVSYTGDMYDNVNILHGIIEATGLSQISNQRKLELASELRTLTQHLVGFPFGPSRASDAEPATEQFVDDMCTDETGGACDQDVLSVDGFVSVAKRFKVQV